MFGLGFQELLVVLAIVLVLFGGKKLPQLSKGIGQTIKEIRKGFSDDEKEKKPVEKETKA
jgi:sec-independent protein translocase protein TatA